jgi:hypothetical protein
MASNHLAVLSALLELDFVVGDAAIFDQWR